MKKILLVLIATAFSSIVFAQNATPGKGKISGVVKDSTNQSKPVEFANVTLMDATTHKPVDGTMCDGDGKFSIPRIAVGRYQLAISFLGYETKTINVTITDKKSDIDLGSVPIGQAAKILKEVVVEGQKALVEEKVDRTVYNAENDQTAKGGDATDVLKRVPMLSVDMDGNVSLRGSQNIKVLINNKPSTISASSVADALKQIPADQIKTVEVITSPSAKYDAEGSAGIINIILKKNNMQGAALNIDGSAGYRGTNLGINGSYRKGKMGFSLGGFGRANYNTPGNFYNNQVTIDPLTNQTSSTTQNANTRNQGLFGNYTLGWDYDIDKSNSLTASVRFGVRNQHTYQDNLTTQIITDNMLSVNYKDVNVQNLSNTVDASLNYTHTFAKPNREFNLLTLFSTNNGTSDFVNQVYGVDDRTTTGFTRNNNKSLNQESTIQADYQTPLTENQLIEFGGKEIMRKVNSSYQYLLSKTDSLNGNYYPNPNTSLSNALNYLQNISAGYLSYTLTAAKVYSLKAGARYEYTTIDAHQTNDDNKLSIPSYGVLVPSINISRKFANGNVLKAAYNRRIQRPSIQYLNPNLQASNQYNVTIGNPQLHPEYTNNFELAYSTYIGGSSLNFSTFARNTDNSIQAVRNVRGDTVQTTYRNIGKQDAYGFSIFTNIIVSGKFSLNGGTDMYYAVLKNTDPNPIYTASNKGWVTNVRLFGNYTIGNGWGLQFFGFLRGRQVQLQGYQGGFHVYSLSLKKDFLNKKVSFGLGAENFLTPSIKIKTTTVSPILDQQSYSTLHYLNFKVTFSYRIGKMTFDSPKKRNKMTISNDDMKEGGGDNNPVASPQAAPQGGGGQVAPQGGAPGGQGKPGGMPFKPGMGQKPNAKSDSTKQHFAKPDSLKQHLAKPDSTQRKPAKADSLKQNLVKPDSVKQKPNP
jgi:outer membrane receptor protein involved in Fe transport